MAKAKDVNISDWVEQDTSPKRDGRYPKTKRPKWQQKLDSKNLDSQNLQAANGKFIAAANNGDMESLSDHAKIIKEALAELNIYDIFGGEGRDEITKEIESWVLSEAKIENNSFDRIIRGYIPIPPSSVYISDTESGESDFLGRNGLVSALSTLICNGKNIEPLTIGLFGDWGVGKTYLINLIEQKIIQYNGESGSTPFVFGRFNAWEYEQSENIQAAMAHEIIKAIKNKPPNFSIFTYFNKFSLVKKLNSILGIVKLKNNDTTHKGIFHLPKIIIMVILHWTIYRPLKLLFTLISAVNQFVVSIFIKSTFVLDFSIRKKPIPAIIFLTAVALTIYTINTNFVSIENIVQEDWVGIKSLLQSHYDLFGSFLAVITLFSASFKSIRTLIAQSFTKELSTYLKLPQYAKMVGEIPAMKKDIRIMADIRLNLKDGWRSFTNGFSLRKRLLFVIDDLDRCDFKGVIRTLEAVKLILNIPQVTVILAVDQRIALATLAYHYKKYGDISRFRDSHNIGREYLGKIIQLPILLPNPGQEETSTFMLNVWSQKLNIKTFFESTEYERRFKYSPILSKAASKNLRENSEKQWEESSKNTTGSKSEDTHEPDSSLDIDEKPNDSGLSIEQHEAFIAWARHFKFTNPRQLKRLNNSYNLFQLYRGQDRQTATINNPNSFEMLISLFALEYINGINSPDTRDHLREYMYRGQNTSQIEIETLIVPFKLLRDDILERIEILEQAKIFVLPTN